MNGHFMADDDDDAKKYYEVKAEVFDLDEKRIGTVRSPGNDHTQMRDPSDWQGKTPREREWVVQDWIPMRDATLITGHGGLGKSILMMQLLYAVGAGKPWLGMGTRQCKAWGIFCEDEDDELHRRSLRIINSMDMEFPDFEGHISYDSLGHETVLVTYEKWAREGDLTSLYYEIKRNAQDHDIRLIILDSLYNFFPGDENNRPQVWSFVHQLQALAREINGAVVMIGHPSKSGLATGDGTSGSTAWHNAFRSRLYLHPPKGTELDDVNNDQWELTRMKGNYAARSTPKITVSWSEDGILVPIKGRSYLEVSAREHECDTLVLDTIRLATNKKIRCPMSSNSKNAPWILGYRMKVITRDYDRDEIKDAAWRLFNAGHIENSSMIDASGHRGDTLAITTGEL